MLHDMITKIQSTFVSPEEVAAYSSTIPDKLHISFAKDGDMYIGYIDEIDGKAIQGLLTTQAENYEDFVHNVNQLAYTYVNMPEKVRPYYGNSFQPPKNAIQKAKGSLTLQKA